MWRVVGFLIWIILTMLVVNSTFELVSMSNTFLNIVGLILLIGYGCISYKTKCLTSIKTKKQDEKN